MCKDCWFSKYNKVLFHYSVSIAAAVVYIPVSGGGGGGGGGDGDDGGDDGDDGYDGDGGGDGGSEGVYPRPLHSPGGNAGCSTMHREHLDINAAT